MQAEKQREEEEMARLDPDERARRLASRDEAKKHAEKKLAHYSKLNAVYYKSAGATISLSQNNPRPEQSTKYQQWLAETDPNNPKNKNAQNGQQKVKSPPNSARSDKSTKSTSSLFSRMFASKASI
jgi:hypothetical protein